MAATSAETLHSGLKVDAYKLVRAIGKGKAGESWLALDGRTGAHVVFSYYSNERFAGTQVVSQFTDAVRSKASITHPELVALLGAGELKERPYLIFEHIAGESLRERMRAGLLPWGEVFRVSTSVASALIEAHKRNVFHHEFKPERVLLGKDGSVKVADAGVARLVLRGLQQATPAQVNDYAAPEILKNDAAAAAADIWALGCMLFELVCGQPPYFARVAQIFLQEVTSADKVRRLPSQPRQAPQEIQDLVYRCLDKSPAKRPSAAEVFEVLRKYTGKPYEQGADPFPGLFPYTRASAAFMPNRDAAAAAFFDHLQTTSLLVIAGPAGTGKTSLVQAAIAPRLEPDYETVWLSPGAKPLESLAAALLDPGAPGKEELASTLAQAPTLFAARLAARTEARGKKQLLVVDRLEDLIGYDATETESSAFLGALSSAAKDRSDPVRVVLVLDDRFTGRLLPKLGIEARQVFTLPLLGPDEIVTGFQALCQAVGHDFEDSAVWQEMNRDLSGDVHALAKASFLMGQVWLRRDATAQKLKRDEYDALGGPRTALERYSELALSGASASQRALVRDLAFRLVSLDEITIEREREALLSGLPKGADAVLDTMTNAGLFVMRQEGEETRFMLAHDSLVHLWPQLRAWLDERAAELGFMNELGNAAAEWEKQGKKGRDTLKRDPLHQADYRVKSATQPVSQNIHAFVKAGLVRELRAKVVHTTLITAIWIALGGLALGATVYALRTRSARVAADEARESMIAGRADAEREDARSAVQKLRQTKDGTELIEARAQVRASLESEDSTLARTLWSDLERMPLEWKRALGIDVAAVAFTADGKRLVAAKGTTLFVIDASSAMPRLVRNASEGRIRALSVSSSDQVALAEGSNKVRVYALASGQSTTFDVNPGCTGLAFSPDGQTLALATKDSVRLINLNAPQDPRELKTGAKLIAFSPDGSTLAALANDKTVTLLDVGSGAARKTYPTGTESVTGLAYLGETLIVADAEGQVRDAETNRTLFKMDKDASALAGARDGSHFAVLGDRGALALARPMPIDELKAASAASPPLRDDIAAVALAKDGSFYVTAGEDPNLHVFDSSSARVTRALSGHSKRVNVLDMTTDGSLLATGGPDGAIHIWQLPQGTLLKTLAGGGFVKRLKFIDKKSLVSGHADGRIRTWNILTGKATAGSSGPAQLWKVIRGSGDRTISPNGARFTSAVYSLDSKDLFTGDSKGRIQVWGEKGPYKPVGQQEGAIHALIHDGRYVYSAAADHSVAVWDASQEPPGAVAKITDVGFEPKTISVNRDGTLLLAAGDNGAMGLFRLPTGDAFWRAPLLVRKGPELATHNGFVALAGKEPGPATEWRKAVLERGRIGSESLDENLVCFASRNKVELWNKAQDKAVASGDVPKVDDLVAGAQGCAIRTGAIVTFFTDTGDVKPLSATATGIGASADGIAVADGTTATVYGPGGEKRSTHTIPQGGSAIIKRGDKLIVGFEDGSVESVPATGGAQLLFASATTNRIIRLVPGPQGTVAAMDSEGEVALWDDGSGRLLSRASLGAKPADMLVSGKTLYAASTRGSSVTLDLSPFEAAYCDLMNDVWTRVPMRWVAGRAIPTDRPAVHPCIK
jgi:eukaryotic-like serine/threonine-protein kinase